MAALLASTTRVSVGTSVLTPTFRYHPGVIAQAFATMGCLAPGRVILGVGSGESLNEAPLGTVWPPPKERFARLRESVELIRRLWSEDRVTFEGSYYRTRNATIYDRPASLPPLYVAASGPATTRFCGRVADGFICTSGKPRSLYAETLIPALTAGAEQADRGLSEIDLMIELKVSFDESLDRAVHDTRHWAALALSPEEKQDVHDPIEMQRLADSLPIERAARRWIVSDDVGVHVKRIKEYVDLGFRHLVFHAPGPDQAHFLDLYSEQVLPRLRALG
jgi:coenzyme F420-dependent glucose-6-phosphate dehydrogenase